MYCRLNTPIAQEWWKVSGTEELKERAGGWGLFGASLLLCSGFSPTPAWWDENTVRSQRNDLGFSPWWWNAKLNLTRITSIQMGTQLYPFRVKPYLWQKRSRAAHTLLLSSGLTSIVAGISICPLFLVLQCPVSCRVVFPVSLLASIIFNYSVQTEIWEFSPPWAEVEIKV